MLNRPFLTGSTIAFIAGCLPGAAFASFIMTPAINTFALYAERSITLGSHDTISGGHVGVLGAATTNFGPQLTLADHVSVDTAHNLFSPTIVLGAQAVAGSVQANKVANNGGTIGASGDFPTTVMPPIPLGQGAPVPAGPDVTVAPGQTQTLTAGHYGSLTLSGKLVLGPGAFTFSSVQIADGGALTSTSTLGCLGSPGPQCATEVVIAG